MSWRRDHSPEGRVAAVLSDEKDPGGYAYSVAHGAGEWASSFIRGIWRTYSQPRTMIFINITLFYAVIILLMQHYGLIHVPALHQFLQALGF